MTRYLIIEDERLVYEDMRRMMSRMRPDYRLAGWAAGVEQAVVLLEAGGIDLILADIRLSDGVCFEIFRRTETNVPVIFTTAYDEYAIKAFKVNSVDYLLKPVDESELELAIGKFERNVLYHIHSDEIGRLSDAYSPCTCKSRFSVQLGDAFMTVPVDEIAYFYSEDKYIFLRTFSGKDYIIDHTLDKIEQAVDRNMFFRVSRNCIANIVSIEKSTRYFGGRLKLYLRPEFKSELMVSRNRVNDFLKWIDGRLE